MKGLSKRKLKEKYERAVAGGKELLAVAQAMEDSGRSMMKKNQSGSTDYQVGAMACVAAMEMKSMYNKMFVEVENKHDNDT